MATIQGGATFAIETLTDILTNLMFSEAPSVVQGLNYFEITLSDYEISLTFIPAAGTTFTYNAAWEQDADSDFLPIGVISGFNIVETYYRDLALPTPQTRFNAEDLSVLGLSAAQVIADPGQIFSGADQLAQVMFDDGVSDDETSFYDPIEGLGGNDVINGYGYGGDGDDVINGGGYGGDGNDTFFANHGFASGDAGDDIIHAGGANGGEGADTIELNTRIAYRIIDNPDEPDPIPEPYDIGGLADGGDGNDVIRMTGYDDEAHGGAGDDVLYGSAGADKFFGDGGFDIVSYGESANGVFVDMKGAVPGVTDATGDAFDGIEQIDGSNFDDALRAGDASGAPGITLSGGAGDDTLVSRAWDDTLIGGIGDDTLTGGSGVNTASYVGALAGVKVDLRIVIQQNTLGDGRDTLTSIENLIGSAFADTLTGNESANLLRGGAGADVLNGAGGADQFFGGAQDDIYIFDNAGDVASEDADAGIDAVRSSVTVTLGANIENLALIGAAAADGFGNELANEMFGNAAANTLVGGAGNDRLEGGGGADVLRGDAGADAMKGGAGNDLYYVDNALDVATEDLNAGIDTIIASRSWAVASNFERVTLSGSGDFNVAGNGLANVLKGNSGDNWLNGSFGKDTLTGGGGRDSFIFNRALGPNNIDTITDYDVLRDVIRIDNAVFAGIGPAGALSANQFRTGALAADADDHIIYNPSNGRLYFDIDGTGAAAQIHFATLIGAPVLNAGEFIII